MEASKANALQKARDVAYWWQFPNFPRNTLEQQPNNHMTRVKITNPSEIFGKNCHYVLTVVFFLKLT